MMCSFVVKVKGKDVQFLLDVYSLEESGDKVRVVNSNSFILSKVPSRDGVTCYSTAQM